MSKKNRNNENVNGNQVNNPAPEKPAETPEKKTGIKEKAKTLWNSKPVRITRKVVVYGAAVFGAVAGTAIAVDTRAARKANPGMDESTGYHNEEE
jgi:3D (Asp-Asp-Asp) domain-containing protein